MLFKKENKIPVKPSATVANKQKMFTMSCGCNSNSDMTSSNKANDGIMLSCFIHWGKHGTKGNDISWQYTPEKTTLEIAGLQLYDTRLSK
jgi:hypothetical protein